MIYVILGMHKSGTTLVSQILHHSGVNMVDELDESVSYDSGNKYERQSVMQLNKEILGMESDEVIHLPAPAEVTAGAGQRLRAAEIVGNCRRRYDDWGFKDPRTCLTYPIWAEALPEHKIIAIYRDPAQLGKHFISPRLLRRYRAPTTTWRYLNRWYEYNMKIIDYLRRSERDYLLLSYNELMCGEQSFARLKAFMGRDLVDRRRPDLYRTRRGGAFVFRAVDRLMKTIRGRDTGNVLAMLDRVNADAYHLDT